MATTEKKMATVSSFFAQCCKLISRPDWLDDLTASLSSLAKCADSGDVVIIATDPDASGRLSGYIIASAGKLVYRCDAVTLIEEEKEFWSFASANYLWVTPTLGLRKEVAARVGGKADGQSMKCENDAITPEQFVALLVGSAKPKRKPAVGVASMEAPAIRLATSAVIELPVQCVLPAVTVDVIEREGARTVRVMDLEVGQTLAMF
jgi:hypothetical protein